MTRLLTDAQLAKIPLTPLKRLAARLERHQLPRAPLGIGIRRLFAPDAVPSEPIPFEDGWIRITEHEGHLAVELSLAETMTGTLVVITIQRTLLGWRAIDVDTIKHTVDTTEHTVDTTEHTVDTTEHTVDTTEHIVDTIEHITLKVLREGSPDKALGAATRALAFALASVTMIFLDADMGLISGLSYAWISAAIYGIWIAPATMFALRPKLIMLSFFTGLLVVVYLTVAESGVPGPAAFMWALAGILVGGPTFPLMRHVTKYRVARWWRDLNIRLRDRQWAFRRRIQRPIWVAMSVVMLLLVLVSIHRITSGPYLYTRWYVTELGRTFEVERWVDQHGEGFERGNASENPEKALSGYTWSGHNGLRPDRLSWDPDSLAGALELTGEPLEAGAALHAVELIASMATTADQRSSVLGILGRTSGASWPDSTLQLLLPVGPAETTAYLTVVLIGDKEVTGYTYSKDGKVATGWELQERRSDVAAP